MGGREVRWGSGRREGEAVLSTGSQSSLPYSLDIAVFRNETTCRVYNYFLLSHTCTWSSQARGSVGADPYVDISTFLVLPPRSLVYQQFNVETFLCAIPCNARHYIHTIDWGHLLIDYSYPYDIIGALGSSPVLNFNCSRIFFLLVNK